MRALPPLLILGLTGSATAAFFALTVPNEIQQPGTQPLEVLAIEQSDNCQGCHGYFDPVTEPFLHWGGSMMGHAGRDPLFWAALAITEQDFDGAGDLCLRCHSPTGWLEDRSTPTDGSGLNPATDGGGVECMVCHRLTNPDNSEHLGVQNAPFIANTGGTNPEAYLGSGMYVLADGIDRYGPRGSASAPHPTVKSSFHRSSALCGTCHDVSNPLVGDLAHNNGSNVPLAPGEFSGVLGDPVATKAAFLNKPHGYGVVERTYSEHVASGLDDYLVSDYLNLPPELQAGALQLTYDAALIAGKGGDYEDGTPRNFSCQSCHMRPAAGEASSYPGAPYRLDIATHDLTGGNTRMGDMILDLDSQGKLMLGGGFDRYDREALAYGQIRARETLRSAASLEVVGNTVKVYNLTGHKLFTGYPEGRRMWLNMRWFDASDQLIREDGAYGDINISIGPRQGVVQSLIDLHDPNTKVYEAEPGITQEWASQLIAMGLDPNSPLMYDRDDASVVQTLGGLAALPAGSTSPSFHFSLNNIVLADNRIPPYRMSYDDAYERNCLPMPDTQYGNPGVGGEFQHWDEFQMNPPAGAVRGDIRLMYQTVSWEYLQFLYLANDGSVPFLADTGRDLIRSWYRTGMAPPEVMATIDW
ncbi:MAG: hypothetical protein ACYSU1_02435 [Planctomycetota bacterium]|jgi:hypothetical protein